MRKLLIHVFDAATPDRPSTPHAAVSQATSLVRDAPSTESVNDGQLRTIVSREVQGQLASHIGELRAEQFRTSAQSAISVQTMKKYPKVRFALS
jgi:hypothetical protein